MKTERELSLDLMRRLYRLACINHGKALFAWHSLDTLANKHDPHAQVEILRRSDICYAWDDAIRHIRMFCEAIHGVTSLEPDENAERGTSPISAVIKTIKSLRELEAFANAVYGNLPKH